jgi:hypothetical protein
LLQRLRDFVAPPLPRRLVAAAALSAPSALVPPAQKDMGSLLHVDDVNSIIEASQRLLHEEYDKNGSLTKT